MTENPSNGKLTVTLDARPKTITFRYHNRLFSSLTCRMTSGPKVAYSTSPESMFRAFAPLSRQRHECWQMLDWRACR